MSGYDSYDGPRGPSFSSSGPSSIYEGTALSGEVYPQYSSGYGGVYGNHGPTSTGSGTYQGGSAGTQYGVGTYGMSNKVIFSLVFMKESYDVWISATYCFNEKWFKCLFCMSNICMGKKL